MNKFTLSALALSVSAILVGCNDGSGFTSTQTEAEQSTQVTDCLLYTSPSPRDRQKSRMPSSA